MKVLVLGASGFVGRRVMNLFGPGRAQGVYRTSPPEGGLKFDAQSNGFEALLPQVGADLTHVMLLHHTSDRVTNVEGVQRIARTCLREGLIPIYASTDYVFSGERGGWREQDSTRPLTDYGRQKAEMETWFAAQPGAWLIARLSKVVSPEIEPRNILSEWAADIQGGRTIRCARDQVLAPVDGRDVASGLLNLIDQGAVGLFNIAGPALTRLELLQVFLGQWRKVFDGPMPDVAPCLLSDVFDHPRPLNTSLDVTKLKAVVDFRPRSMEAVCEELVSQAASCL